MKKSFRTIKPNIVNYRSQKNFSNEAFLGNICYKKLSKKNSQTTMMGCKGFVTEISADAWLGIF